MSLLFCSLVLFTACNSGIDAKNANRILGFKLPADVNKTEHNRTSNHNPTGDGTLFLGYSFNNSDTTYLMANCKEHGFSKLPINEEALIDGAIFQYISREDSLGYYKLNKDRDGMSYSIGVIDLAKNKIYVYEALY